ncbi:MAG TPA: thioesterase family protein [Candidatus Scatomorpha merdipullorum]|uniref:Thioesterase family protein n=1 Tax=Candidatus Scatomorpha merdipullorum TaxID=2840927 RepID=A0A9D1JU77_9FIRM|nr:thioesterase family protein [Candidatus Scatomorpha merdipullorum]
MPLTPGIKGSASCVVGPEDTAKALGSGAVDVFSTPKLVALMEKAALLSVRDYLDEGMDTVGTHLDISHSAATPVGMTVRAESELIEVDRRRLVFSVKAWDETELVGEGTHERFIIDRDKFLAKCSSKA